MSADLSAELLARTLDALTTGSVLFDPDWTIVHVNPAAAALVGRVPQDLVDRNIWVALPEVGGTIFHSFLLHARNAGRPVTWQGFYAPTRRWIRATAGPEGAAGKSVGSQPLVEDGSAVGGMTMSLVGTSAPVTSPSPE